MEHLLNPGNGTDGMEVFQRGIIIHNVTLRSKHDVLVVLHGLFQRFDGFDASHVKVDSLIRKNCQPAQSQHRESPGNKLF